MDRPVPCAAKYGAVKALCIVATQRDRPVAGVVIRVLFTSSTSFASRVR